MIVSILVFTAYHREAQAKYGDYFRDSVRSSTKMCFFTEANHSQVVTFVVIRRQSIQYIYAFLIVKLFQGFIVL